MRDDLQPWDRQSGERDRAWRAFTRYRDLGTGERSLPRLASDMVGETPEVDRKPESVQRQLERWSSRHSWRARVEAWDREQDRRAREATHDLVRLMNERHLEIAVAGLDLVMKPVTALLGEIDADPAYFETMTPSEHLLWCDRTLKHLSGLAALERQAREASVADAQRITSGTTDEMPAFATTVWLADVYDALAEAGVKPPLPGGESTAEDGSEPPSGDDDAEAA
jgi:hypothetical protein